MPQRAAVVLCVLLAASPAFGQNPGVPLELYAGIGIVNDVTMAVRAPSIAGGMSWDYNASWWLVPILEGEFNTAGKPEPCRSASDSPDYCDDGIWLFGARFRHNPNAVSGVRPFATLLVGEYFDASGTDGRLFDGSHFAVQSGAGIEIRWARSFQGVRISADVRHVSGLERYRHQIRLLGAYVIGPRRYKPHP